MLCSEILPKSNVLVIRRLCAIIRFVPVAGCSFVLHLNQNLYERIMFSPEKEKRAPSIEVCGFLLKEI